MSISRLKDKTKWTMADIADAVLELHDCVHKHQDETRARLEGNHAIISGQVVQVRDKVDEMDERLTSEIKEVDNNVRMAEQKIARVEGIQSTIYGVKTNADTGQVTIPARKKSLMTMPLWQAVPVVLALVAGGSGVYKLLVEIAVAVNHYLMTAAK